MGGKGDADIFQSKLSVISTADCPPSYQSRYIYSYPARSGIRREQFAYSAPRILINFALS